MQFNKESALEFAEYLKNKPKEKRMAEIKKIGHEDVTEFIKMLVEIGGGVPHKVDSAFNVIVSKKDQLCYAEDNDGTMAAMKIYHNNRVPGDYLVLNPFKKEERTPSPDMRWFMETMELKMVAFLRMIMSEIIDIALNKDEEVLFDLQKHMKLPDEAVSPSMKDEIKKIAKEDLLYYLWDETKKTGKLQSFIDSADIQANYGSKIKKKTWSYVTAIVEGIFNLKPSQMAEQFTYTSTLALIPRTEAMLKLSQMFYKYIQPICSILGMSCVDNDLWESHMPYIEKYTRITQWDDGIRQKPVEVVAAPWGGTAAPSATASAQQPVTAVQSVVPQNQQVVPASDVAMSPTGYPEPQKPQMATVMTAYGPRVVPVAPVAAAPMVSAPVPGNNFGIPTPQFGIPQMSYGIPQMSTPMMPNLMNGMMPGMNGMMPGMGMPGMMNNMQGMPMPNMPGMMNGMMPGMPITNMPMPNMIMSPMGYPMIDPSKINQYAMTTPPAKM